MEAIIGDRNRVQKHVARARTILGSADRLSVAEVARRAGIGRPAVWRWQRCFAQAEVDGLLRDATRKPGKAPLGDPDRAPGGGADLRRAARRSDPLDRPRLGQRLGRLRCRWSVAFIGRLRDELRNEEIFENLAHARRLLERWRLDYNHVRPHSAHSGLPPAAARLLAAGARPGLADGPAERPLAPSPSPAINPKGSPHERGTSGERVTGSRPSPI